MTLPDTTPLPTDSAPLYRDASASIDDRVADLLGRMTLDEKLAQLGSAWIFQLAGHDGLDLERAAPLLEHGLGQVTRLSGASSFGAADSAAHANAIQRHLTERTRLGIPAVVHEEICSGLMAREAVAYPQAIGVAASFRPEHNRAMADQIRRQMRAVGAHQGLSPVLDICRDPRWGRLEETYGEDPFLVTAMGVEFVHGLQGDDLRSGVAATAKHFVGYGASEGGMNWAPAHLPERELRDVYLRPFEAAVRDAGVASIMNGYHELDGIPCGADDWLLDEVLRREWGFDGTVVSDYFAVKQLFEYHHVAGGPSEAAVTALTAGIDVELPGTDCYGGPLCEAVDTGRIDVALVDRAVARVLGAKFRLGLFEQPFVDEGSVALHTRTDEQSALADRVAADSLVLLSNDGVLPLQPSAKVAVIGPHADDPRLLFGDYSYLAHVESLIEVLRSGRNVFAMPLEHGVDVEQDGAFEHVPTPLTAMRERLGESVSFTPGCAVTDSDRSGFDAAVAAAAAADVAVLVLGERSGLTDDCTTGESRDVSSLNLPGVQEELVHAVAATGTPTVLVIVAGRPIGSPEVHDAAAAVLIAWLPGERGGPAIADALVGVTVPGGKLPISYPRSSGQIPIFYAHKVSGGRSHWKGEYVDLSNEPLYPFGHGLSYTTFSVVPHEVAVRASAGDVVEISATVTNTGDRTGDEVVQLYATDPVASVTRPVRELVGFARVALAPGASTRVVFELSVDALGFTGRDLTHVVEPGRIDLAVGTSSAVTMPIGSITVDGDDAVHVDRVMTTPVRLEPC
jgi:beta-glucosidase